MQKTRIDPTAPKWITADTPQRQKIKAWIVGLTAEILDVVDPDVRGKLIAARSNLEDAYAAAAPRVTP